MSRRVVSAQVGKAPARLPTALWFVTGFAAAAPGLLLLTNAESRLSQAAGAALIVAGVVAFLIGAARAHVYSTRRLLPAVAVVVLLCATAPLILEVDGQVSPGGWVMFGGAAGVLALLACVLTLRANKRRAGR